MGLKLKLAHTLDVDDAFMFFALTKGLTKSQQYEIEYINKDIEELNIEAEQELYDITALSFHAYSYVSDKYIILPCGASFGDRYGPKLVARLGFNELKLGQTPVAVPGIRTSGAYLLQMYRPNTPVIEYPSNEIIKALNKNEVETGVVIHEGQLIYEDYNLKRLVDFGVWWAQKTSGLPVPLGCFVLHRRLSAHIIPITNMLREAILYALDHREEAIAYALQSGNYLDRHTVQTYIAMYINQCSLDMGTKGRQSTELLLKMGAENGITPEIEDIQGIWR